MIKRATTFFAPASSADLCLFRYLFCGALAITLLVVGLYPNSLRLRLR